MPAPVVGVRFPTELLDQIDGLIGTTGKNRSEVVLNLVKRGLGIDADSTTAEIADRLGALEKKLKTC
jgi:metal-responsive CopG/Arc/MetJ family transcriptional regulator